MSVGAAADFCLPARVQLTNRLLAFLGMISYLLYLAKTFQLAASSLIFESGRRAVFAVNLHFAPRRPRVRSEPSI